VNDPHIVTIHDIDGTLPGSPMGSTRVTNGSMAPTDGSGRRSCRIEGRAPRPHLRRVPPPVTWTRGHGRLSWCRGRPYHGRGGAARPPPWPGPAPPLIGGASASLGITAARPRQHGAETPASRRRTPVSRQRNPDVASADPRHRASGPRQRGPGPPQALPAQ
jgi:hypothetical protein